MDYAGRYINMDRSVERRRALEAQFAAFGCADRYERFAGVDGQSLDRSASSLTAGECGCFESHYRCIKESMGEDRHLHIVEDDVVFGPSTIALIDQVAADAFGQGEMVFTDIFVRGELVTIQLLMNYYRLSGALQARAGGEAGWPSFVNFLDLKQASFAGSASYFLRSDAKARLLSLMERELAAGPTVPVDIFFHRIIHAGELSACCTLPFLTSVDPAAIVSTTIEGRPQLSGSALAFFMLRNYFFVDKDDATLERLGRELTGPVENSNYMNPVLDVFRYVFGEDFVAF